MAFVVIYDACVLYPAPLRDLLIRLATTGLFRVKWTDQILDECFRKPNRRNEAHPWYGHQTATDIVCFGNSFDLCIGLCNLLV